MLFFHLCQDFNSLSDVLTFYYIGCLFCSFNKCLSDVMIFLWCPSFGFLYFEYFIAVVSSFIKRNLEMFFYFYKSEEVT